MDSLHGRLRSALVAVGLVVVGGSCSRSSTGGRSAPSGSWGTATLPAAWPPVLDAAHLFGQDPQCSETDRQPQRVGVRIPEEAGQPAPEGINPDHGGGNEEQQFTDPASACHVGASSRKTGCSRAFGSGGISSPGTGRRAISRY